MSNSPEWQLLTYSRARRSAFFCKRRSVLRNNFELTPLVLSSIFFWTKNSVQYLWIWRDLVTNVLYNGQCRAWWSHFKSVVVCCNFTEAKSREVSVLLDKELFLKNRTMLAKKRSFWPSSRLITVDLDYCLSLSLAQLVRFWFKSLWSLTIQERQFLQGNLFILAVCTHEVALFLCSLHLL